jgi:hypothetical protein
MGNIFKVFLVHRTSGEWQTAVSWVHHGPHSTRQRAIRKAQRRARLYGGNVIVANEIDGVASESKSDASQGGEISPSPC